MLKRFWPTIAAIFIAVSALLAPTAASAHSQFLESDPQEGSTVTRPDEVRLTFNEPLRDPSFAALSINGDVHEDGLKARRDGSDLVATVVGEDLPAGAWTVSYRVVSSDGHPIEGRVNFTVTDDGSAPTATPSDAGEDEQANSDQEATANAESDDSSILPLAIVVVVVVAALVFGVNVFLVRRRSR